MPGDPAWTAMPDVPDRYFWGQFYERFQFRPRFHQDGQRSIIEPRGSVTLDLRPLYAGAEHRANADETTVNLIIRDAFIQVFEPDTRLAVLDWQHPSYWFHPHRSTGRPESWPVQPIPDGDYYIFLTEDLSTGTFGHPWEPSLCIFGEALVELLVPRLSTALPLLRDSYGAGPDDHGSP